MMIIIGREVFDVKVSVIYVERCPSIDNAWDCGIEITGLGQEWDGEVTLIRAGRWGDISNWMSASLVRLVDVVDNYRDLLDEIEAVASNAITNRI
jgi:hypothetical protein